jgi:hypothetical protein
MGTMHAENTIMIERPINEVFEYVSTPENDPTWVSVSLRHERMKILGQTASNTWEVTDYQPPTGIAYRATSGLLSGTAVRLRLEPVGGGTKLTHAVDLESRGIHYKVIAPLIQWVAQRLLDSLDRTLKNLLEDEPSTPGPRPETASGTLTGAIVVAASVVAGIALLLLRRRNRSSRR